MRRKEKKGQKERKKREANACTHTHIHIAFIHFFSFTDKHTHIFSLSFLPLTVHVMKNRRAKLHKSKKTLSHRNLIDSICCLLNRTNKNWRQCLYWIRYQMQVSFDMNDHHWRRKYFFFYFSCSPSSTSDHASIQVSALFFFFLFIKYSFFCLVCSSLSWMSRFDAYSYSTLIHWTSFTSFTDDSSMNT